MTRNKNSNQTLFEPSIKKKRIRKRRKRVRKRSKKTLKAIETILKEQKIDNVTETTANRIPGKENEKALILKLLGDKATANGIHICYDDEMNALQDLDLAILASSPEDYKTYTKLLRKEYESMSDELYQQMRVRVLQTLLMIPNIYSTPEYQLKYESVARENIEEEIRALKG